LITDSEEVIDQAWQIVFRELTSHTRQVHAGDWRQLRR